MESQTDVGLPWEGKMMVEPPPHKLLTRLTLFTLLQKSDKGQTFY